MNCCLLSWGEYLSIKRAMWFRKCLFVTWRTLKFLCISEGSTADSLGKDMQVSKWNVTVGIQQEVRGQTEKNLLSHCHIFFLSRSWSWSNQPFPLSMRLCSHKFTQQLVVSTQLSQKGTLHAWHQSGSEGNSRNWCALIRAEGKQLTARPANAPSKDTFLFSFLYFIFNF